MRPAEMLYLLDVVDEAMPLPGLGGPAAAVAQTMKPVSTTNLARTADFALPGLSANAPMAMMPPSVSTPMPPIGMPQQMPPIPGTLGHMSNPPYGMPPPNQGYGGGPMGRQDGPMGFMPPPSDAMGPRRGGPLPSQEQMLQSIGYEPPPPQQRGNRGRRRG
jgi:hypothetical protein